MEPVLELRQVSKAYPRHRALTDISLAIEPGTFFSLLGPSGCGKTTTLRLVGGFEQPSSGEILLDGTRIDGLKPYQRNVSTVFQNYALFPHLSVRDNVEFGLRRKGFANIAHRAQELIDLVELTGKESRRPAEISGGEKQRVALARALAVSPDLLLLDEPLSALDPKLRKQMRSELKALQRRVGVTFLFVTHDQEEALSLSDRIAVMNHGRLEQVGTPREVYLQPATRFVASFLGAVNWVDSIGVRPEATRVSHELPASGVRWLPATVRNTVFLGNCLQVEAELSTGEPVTAEVSRLERGFDPGQQVHIWWHPSDELRFTA